LRLPLFLKHKGRRLSRTKRAENALIQGFGGGRCDKMGAIETRRESGTMSQSCRMSLTLEQKTNLDGVPKAAELIEITGAHALEASDRAILNLLYQHAYDSGHLGDPGASWELPITALRPSKHNGTDRIRDSLSRLLSVQVKVAYREGATGRDRVLLTHLFESFDIPADEGIGGPVRFRVPISLVPVLAQSSRWGRIKAEIVCAMSSKYAIALYELVQLRGNMDRCVERFALDRFRDLLGVPPGAYDRGNDFMKRVIDPAVLEVNGLSEFGVKVEVERSYSRAPITGVMLGWWRKTGEDYRATYQERQRSKLGRMARLKGSVEAATLPGANRKTAQRDPDRRPMVQTSSN
jgi:hypothetical protein